MTEPAHADTPGPAEAGPAPRPGWWRPAAWIVVATLALLPPGPSLPVVGLVVVAGLATLTGERISSIPGRIALSSR